MREYTTSDFGFAAYLEAIKAYERKEDNKLTFLIPDEVNIQALKKEYKNSDFNYYNEVLRDIVSKKTKGN